LFASEFARHENHYRKFICQMNGGQDAIKPALIFLTYTRREGKPEKSCHLAKVLCGNFNAPADSPLWSMSSRLMSCAELIMCESAGAMSPIAKRRGH